jgi:hypothetical protein
MPLDLLVPDLLLPPDAPAPLREARLPGLEKWLARADVTRSTAIGAERWLAERYALEHPPPVAAVALAGEDALHPGEWVRADPVHLRIDGDSVVVHDASILGVRRDEADALVAALREFFAQDGLRFHAPRPDRWYVEVPRGELPATVPLEEARGRNAFGLLPSGGKTINWRSAITEAQMVLSQHEVNRRREEAGEPQVNSVWFWGEGRAPESVARRYDAVHAQDPFPRGLGRLSGASVAPPPSSIGDLDLIGAAQSALVVLDALSAPLHRAALDAWTAAAASLDERWFRGLGEAIDRFGSVRVVLPRVEDTLIATLGRSARRRWLRRAKPLASHA